MNLKPQTVLKVAFLITLGAIPSCFAISTAQAPCEQSAQTENEGVCARIQAIEKQSLAQPAKAGELLTAFAATNPAQLEKATLTLVGTFAKKLPADQLQPAISRLMQSAASVISGRIPAPDFSKTTNEEERRQAQFEQDLRVAAAVQELTRQAVETIKENLAMPGQSLSSDLKGVTAEDEIVIDPQAYASLMKKAMEQAVKGSLAGLGTRAARIPEAYLPNVKSLRQEKGSYSYALAETPLDEKIPSAVAAPVEEKKTEPKQ